MKHKWKKYFFSLVVGCMLFFVCTAKAKAQNLVVVLDPGHDNVHTGAAGNNLREEYLNLKIALACKMELETYDGVSVYMIRSSEVCPYGGSGIGNSVKCNLKRVEYSKNVGANVYVSLHNNSSTSTSARGVGVYYPTTNYNAYCGQQGGKLADAILGQLVLTGLNNRGKSVRYSEDNTLYPDGSLADYYAVIKHNKLNGIPAIIVEHAFVSNYQDATQFLGSEDKLWALGVLDATGIANCYGLTKKIDYSHAVLSASEQNGKKVFRVQAANIKGGNNVRFAVWSDAGGQDDIIWYPASKDANGNWFADVTVANHKTAGNYTVHAYAEQSTFIGQTSFKVGAPSAQSVLVTNKDSVKGVFDMTVTGAKSDVDISKVEIAVWKKSDMSDLKWITARKVSEGNYTVTAGINNFGYEYGSFRVHTYVRDVNGIAACVNKETVVLTPSEPQLAVTKTAVSAVYEVQAENVPYGSGVESVELHVWPENQSMDMTVYKAEKMQDESWKAYVIPAKSGEADNYSAQIYAVLKNNSKVLLGVLTWQVPNGKQEVLSLQEADGSYLWNGTDVQVKMNQLPQNSLLKLSPYCDYKAIQTWLEKNSGFLYGDFIAYNLNFEEATKEAVVPVTEEAITPATEEAVTPVTGDAVTPVTEDAVSAVTEEAVIIQTAAITMVIPEHMRERELAVFQIENKEITPDAAVDVPIALPFTISEDRETLTFTAKPEGTFVLAWREARKRGDADGNGEIELKDAQLVLKSALDLSQLSEIAQKFCDVDADGKITLNDAKIILRAALGIIEIS